MHVEAHSCWLIVKTSSHGLPGASCLPLSRALSTLYPLTLTSPWGLVQFSHSADEITKAEVTRAESTPRAEAAGWVTWSAEKSHMVHSTGWWVGPAYSETVKVLRLPDPWCVMSLTRFCALQSWPVRHSSERACREEMAVSSSASGCLEALEPGPGRTRQS